MSTNSEKLKKLRDAIDHKLSRLPTVPKPDLYELRRSDFKNPPIIVEHVAKSILMLFGIEPFNWKTAQLVFQDEDHVNQICMTAKQFRFQDIQRENYEAFRNYVDSHSKAYDHDAMWQTCRSCLQLSQWAKHMVALVRDYLDFFALGGHIAEQVVLPSQREFPTQNTQSSIKTALAESEKPKTESKDELNERLNHLMQNTAPVSNPNLVEIQQLEVATSGLILLSGGKLRQYSASVQDLPKNLKDFDLSQLKQPEFGERCTAIGELLTENKQLLEDPKSPFVQEMISFLRNVVEIAAIHQKLK